MEMNFREMARYYVSDTILKMKNKMIISAVMFLATLFAFTIWFMLAKSGNFDVAQKAYYVFFGSFTASMYYIWMNRASIKGTGEKTFGYENTELFNGLFVVFVSLLCFTIMLASNKSFLRGALGLLMLIGLFLLLVNLTELAAGEIEEAKELYESIRTRLKEEKVVKKEVERKMAIRIAEMEDKINVLEGGISIPTFIRLRNKRSVV